MKTLIHYDHLLKTIIVQKLDNKEDVELHLRNYPDDDEPDPYWRVLEGKWNVVEIDSRQKPQKRKRIRLKIEDR